MNWKHESKDWRNRWKRLISWAWMWQACYFLDCYPISISRGFLVLRTLQPIMQGLKFRFNPAFNEGDEVLLDGEQAIIVKIGLRETVFGCYGSRGYTWRYVANDLDRYT